MMRTILKIWALLLPIFAALAACTGTPTTTAMTTATKPAHHVDMVDVSLSPATVNDPSVTGAVERRIGVDMAKNVQLGDTITVYEAGARSADRMVAHPTVVTDYNLRVPTAIAKVKEDFGDIVARFRAQGGDNSTNLLLTLESIRPDCTPRSTVTIITDGVEESEGYSAAKALAANKAVNLPPPPSKYLTGCRVQFLGFGLTEDPSADKEQLLPARQLNALRQGWTTYLVAAGIRPDDIEFVSVL